MKFITVRDLRTTPAQIWKTLLHEQEMILTNNGKPIALISSIDETNFEETLTMVRRSKMQLAIQKAQRYAVMQNVQLTEAEIESEIQSARAEIRERG